MAEAEQIARWTRAEEALRGTAIAMGPILDPEATALVEEFLDHNELGVAMDALVDAAPASDAIELPEGTIDGFRAASTEMEGYLPDTWGEFIARFRGHS